MKDSFRDECGVFGIWNHPEASRLTYLGLFALQHRGQESAGIVTLKKNSETHPESTLGQSQPENKTLKDGEHIHHRGLGLVADVFNESELDRLNGPIAIGHVRYSTTGDNLLTNAQPLTAQLYGGPVAIAHNGNIVNAAKLREELQESGAIFQGSSDTEIIIHLLARSRGKTFEERLLSSLQRLEGAYSLAILTHNSLIAVRDPMGFRPLSLGKVYSESDSSQFSWVFASETCAFDLIGAKFERDLKPGEILIIEKGITRSLWLPEAKRLAQCIFEHVYFARPDSVVFGLPVYASRKNLGKILAQEHPADADLVIPVPDSGVAAALGYAEESKIPFDMGIIRNHYVGRTFIEPRSAIRSFGVKIKLNPQSAILKDKRVVVVDDSIVRGTTSKKIIGLIRQAGAKEVHLRVAAPPTTGPCYYGVDTPTKNELIAATHTVPEIQEFLGCDSLGYLSVEGLNKAVLGAASETMKSDNKTFCAACFDGNYPTQLYT